MSKCALDIKKDIIDEAGEMLSQRGAQINGAYGNFPNPSKASRAIAEVNREFGDLVVKEGEKGSFFIDPSEPLVQEYLDEYNRSQTLLDEETARKMQKDEMERGGYTEEDRGEYFQLESAENAMSNLSILDSIINKLGMFNPYFRRNDVDSTLKQKLLEMGLTQYEISYLEALDQKSPKDRLNFSVLIANEYSKHLQSNLLETRLMRLKKMEANKELDKDLLDFLAPMGVRMEELDSLKERFGTDAFGVADILYRVIYASKNRKLDTIPEEVAHFYVEMMGTKEGLGEKLMDKIEGWSEYPKIYAEYSSVYLTREGQPDVAKIKKEAIGKAIAEAIIKQYASRSENIPQGERSFWQEVLSLIEKIRAIFQRSANYKPLEVITDEIATKIFNKDYSDTLERIQSVKQKNRELKTYEGTLASIPKVKSVIDKIISLGGILSGSLALRYQGELYRNESEKIHDLDFSIDYNVYQGNWEKFVEDFKKVFPNYRQISKSAFPGNSGERVLNGLITNNDALYEKFMSLPGDFNSRLDQFTLEEQEQMLLVDFFFNPEGFTTPNVRGLQSADAIFSAKSSMGMRPKDAFDLVNFKPYTGTPSQLSSYSYAQMGEMPMSTASKETLDKVKQVLKKMGVSIEALSEYLKGNPNVNATTINGVADLVRGVIAIAEGKEDVALTEEMVHVATAILEQTNPKLVTEMISKIDRFEIYQRVLAAYKNNKDYQLPNGKPNIRKIKKEAVDKLIAELIINKNEGTTEFPELMQEANRSMVRNWWNTITDLFRGMYKKSNIKIFEDVAEMVSKGEVGGTIGDVKNTEVFYQLTDAQTKKINEIKETSNRIEKKIDKKESDPILMDTEEASNYYVFKELDGSLTRIVNRVTDRVKKWYAQRFRDKKFTEAEVKFNELKRDYGTKYHSFFEEIHKRYFNSDGSKRDVPGDRPYISDTVDSEVYDKIEKYYTELINLLPEGTAVLSEVIVYDPKKKEAGTIDFLAIDRNGKAHILDWKFMYVSPDSKTDDVAWFKQGAYNIQLGRYKEMLRDVYGIKEFGMIRAVPFLMNFERINPKDKNSEYIIKGISAGSADKTKITNLKLMPVAEETESTGDEQLDKLLKRLNALLKQYAKEKVTDEDEREYKIERLNTIRRAMRVVQGSGNLAPLIDVIEVMRKDGERILEDYETTYKDKISTRQDFNDPVLSDFAEDMNNYLNSSEIFTNISALIGESIYSEGMLKEAKTEEEKETVLQLKEVLIKLREEQEGISRLRLRLGDASRDFADKHIGQRNLVGGLLNVEAVIKGLGSMFRGVSELPTAALRLLYKITTVAKGKAMEESLREVEELMALRKKLADRGGDLRSLVKKIYQKDEKGGFVNKLIRRYQKEFYTKMDELAKEGGDKDWLMENVDIEEYKKEATEKMNENIEKLKRRRFPGTVAEEEEAREDAIIEEKRKWDITRGDFTGWNNYILKRHPKEKWQTQEYLDIKKDKDLLELYNFITKFNEKSKDVGYISNIVSSTFLPFIRKGTAEQLVWNNSISSVVNFRENLKIKADDVGYGQYDALTGELENSIPKYYIHDFSKKEDGTNDYSDVSEDLFKNMILYIQSVNKYKFLSEVEGQIKLIKTVETFKGNLVTSREGDAVRDGGNTVETAGKNKNARFFDDFMRALLYDQKYALSDADTPLYVDKVLNFGKKLVNKVAGKEVWKEGDDATATSLVKTMDAANRAFQLKTLGLNPISGAVNAFGGNIQVATQAGTYFDASEFFKNEAKLSVMKFTNKEEEKLFTETMRVFMPMKDDPSSELMKEAGMSVATRGSASDFLMFFMRYPEQLIEKAVFESILENTMIENGKIVNIKDFVKSKYKGRSASSASYRQTKEKIKKEVEELKRTRSIAKTRKIENGKLVIPGLDLNNKEEILRLTNLTRRISRNATGGISDGDINIMSMNVWTRSMMVFRQWIPKLADTRFSEFRKVSDDFGVYIDDEGQIQGEKYDIGRIRLLGIVLGTSLQSFSNTIGNILSMNEEGVKAIDKMYEEFARKYEERTGQPLTMSKDDFTDMVITNLRNQLRELLVLASLIGVTFSMGFIAPDDDDDKATKNRFRYAQRVVDRFVDELSFFYNPVNFEQILSGSAFPALGLIKDFTAFTNSLFEEITGFDFSDPTKTVDEVREKSKPIKHLIKNLPAGRQVLTFLASIDEGFAKDFDITIQRETMK